MPYLVTVFVMFGIDVAGLPVMEKREFHLEVEPGSDEYEFDQLMRMLQKRLPGLGFEVSHYVPDWAGTPIEAFSIELEAA